MRAAIVIALAGCATSYQSARTLAPGKTQVTAGIARIDTLGEGDLDEAIYLGDVQVRTGLSERSDGGFRIQRTAGVGETVSMASIDPKFVLTPPGATFAISASLPLGILWTEEGTDAEDQTYIVAPSMFFGFDLSPGIELVISPKLFYIKPEGEDGETEFGASIGVRIGDPSRTWAVHPEIGFFRFSEGDESEEFLTFGVGISAGN